MVANNYEFSISIKQTKGLLRVVLSGICCELLAYSGGLLIYKFSGVGVTNPSNMIVILNKEHVILIALQNNGKE